MKQRGFNLLSIFILLITITACGGTTATGSTDSSSDDDSSTDDSPTNSGDDASTNIAAGSLGFFFSVSSESSDTINVQGESITVESGSSYIYRYIHDTTELSRMDNTYDAYNNYSCDSAGAQVPYTVAGRLFNIEVCPDIEDGESIVDLEEINPETGAVISTCNYNASGTSQVGILYAVIGDTLYYENTSGDMVTRSLSSSGCGAETVLSAWPADVGNGYDSEIYNVGEGLISIYNDTYDSGVYVIYSNNSSTGAILASLLTVDEADVYGGFYAGDDSIYWYDYNSSTFVLTIKRYALNGSATTIATVSPSPREVRNVAIDDDDGKVLIAYETFTRDDNGYATDVTGHFYTYDVSSSTLSQLGDDGSFFDSDLQMIVF